VLNLNLIEKFKYINNPLCDSWSNLGDKEKDIIIQGRIERDAMSYADINRIIQQWKDSNIDEYNDHYLNMMKLIVEKLSFAGNVDILEIGPGTGELVGLLGDLFSPNATYTAMDIAQPFLDFIKEEKKHQLSKFKSVNFISGNFKDYSFEKKYDLIIICGSLHHMPFRMEIYKKLYELCNENAYVVLVDGRNRNFCPLTISRNIRKVLSPDFDILDHCHFLTEKEMKRIPHITDFALHNLYFSVPKPKKLFHYLYNFLYKNKYDNKYKFELNICKKMPAKYFATQMFVVLKKNSGDGS